MPGFVDISGLGDKRLSAKLAQLDLKVQKKMVRKALRKAGRPVLEEARARVPVDTGRLRDGLFLRATKRKRGTFGVEVAMPLRADLGISANAKGYYPAVIEYGAENHPPQPFLRPALDANKERAIRIVADFVRSEISSAVADGRVHGSVR